MVNLPDNTVGAFTYDILDVILLADVEGDLASSASLCAAHFGVSLGGLFTTDKVIWLYRGL